MFAIRFRPAGREDFSAIVGLIDSAEELFRVYPSGRFPLTVDQLEHLFAVRRELTVVEVENKVVGFANYYNVEEGVRGFIGNVVVASSLRGRGVGRRLLQHMVRVGFDRLKLPELCISVFTSNTPAFLLYTDMGFSPYRLESRRDPGGEHAALIHMKLRANQPSDGENKRR